MDLILRPNSEQDPRSRVQARLCLWFNLLVLEASNFVFSNTVSRLACHWRSLNCAVRPTLHPFLSHANQGLVPCKGKYVHDRNMCRLHRASHNDIFYFIFSHKKLGEIEAIEPLHFILLEKYANTPIDKSSIYTFLFQSSRYRKSLISSTTM